MEQAVATLGADGVDKILAGAMADINAMFRFADDISPTTEPVQPYTPDDPTGPNAATLALFMVASVSEIRVFLQIAHDSGQPSLMVRAVDSFAPKAMKAYLPRAAPEPSTTSVVATPAAILHESGIPALSGSVKRGKGTGWTYFCVLWDV
ncbi:hypothetical protein VTI28DRAFT_4665 [Corynascus sepedonium]